jgi:hypothetical protein
MSDHISEDDLERLIVGAVKDETELATLEEHLLWCHDCLDLVLGAENYVDTIRVGLVHMSER